VQLAWTILATILILLAIAELSLRAIAGLGNPLLYCADPEIGYLLAPNQRLRRWCKRIQVNEYSMRSASIAPEKPRSMLRVLLLGDSVANGGWWTDQDATIAASIQRQLSQKRPEFPVEVLNASANSWNPRNELAYLKRFGTFAADAIVVLINTDDLFGTQPTALPVGRDRNYPDRQPPLALIEAIQRYLLRPQPLPELEAIYQEGGDRVGKNLTAIAQMYEIACENNARFILALTPLKREVCGQGRDYERKARMRLNEWVQAHSVTFVDFLSPFAAVEKPETLFRDRIHLSAAGDSLVSRLIGQHLDATAS
jgi:lysophospholipase L1-like esterase